MKKALLLSVALVLVASSLAAAPSRPALTLPLSGQFTDAVGGAGTFEGSFKLTEFVASGNVLLARGIVVGTLTDSTGRAIGSVMKPADLPVTLPTPAQRARGGKLSAEANATCDVLNLVLGPLHLDLLGNLLCSVLGLLDGAGALVDIAQALNRILDVLSGILG